MAKEFKRISCVAGQYTQISTGQASVSFRSTLTYGGRVAFGATQPAVDFADYGDVYPGEPVELGTLSATDCLWYKPNSATEVLQVVRG